MPTSITKSRVRATIEASAARGHGAARVRTCSALTPPMMPTAASLLMDVLVGGGALVVGERVRRRLGQPERDRAGDDARRLGAGRRVVRGRTRSRCLPLMTPRFARALMASVWTLPPRSVKPASVVSRGTPARARARATNVASWPAGDVGVRRERRRRWCRTTTPKRARHSMAFSCTVPLMSVNALSRSAGQANSVRSRGGAAAAPAGAASPADPTPSPPRGEGPRPLPPFDTPFAPPGRGAGRHRSQRRRSACAADRRSGETLVGFPTRRGAFPRHVLSGGGGSVATVADRVAAIVAPAVEALGLDLYDIEHTGGSLRVLVDRPGGVDLDAITDATRALSRALDDADPIDGALHPRGVEPRPRAAAAHRRALRRRRRAGRDRQRQDQARRRGRAPPRRHRRRRRRRRRRARPRRRRRPRRALRRDREGPHRLRLGARPSTRQAQAQAQEAQR